MPPHRPPPSPKRIAGLWVLGAKWAGGTIDETMHRKKKKDGWNYAQERTQVHSRYTIGCLIIIPLSRYLHPPLHETLQHFRHDAIRKIICVIRVRYICMVYA